MRHTLHFLQTNEAVITTKIYTVALYTLAKAVQMHSLFSLVAKIGPRSCYWVYWTALCLRNANQTDLFLLG